MSSETEAEPQKCLTLVQELLRRHHQARPAIYMFQMVGFTGLAPLVPNFASDYGVYNFHAIGLAGL